MSKLVYKTKGNSNPRGKAKVYFACHPEDFQNYFEEISAEVLSINDCAIWYESNYEESYDAEELSVGLSSMNLFVVPVTSRLLNTANRCLEVEIPYALANHIPILPLMQELGLEGMFNKKCGNLQALNKLEQDETAISYEEKFKKYIESVLVSDELAQQVRSAFDAYIFLSYRKKDRQYANKLMKLIHENDFARDIAIWYDEFLTPGENFNDAIEAALKKSNLFAMVVTPNLVNEPNYVQRVEYPKALETTKSIVPVEIAELNEHEKQLLHTQYQGIQPCQPQELSTALLESLKHIALRQNDTDPKHNYFIGLAYLNGIDVEVNRDYARKLIEGASEAGLIEATEKLTAMYKLGDGVERDYYKSAEYQQSVVEYYEKQWLEKQDEEAADAYFNNLWDFGKNLEALRKLTEAQVVYRTMLDVAEKTKKSQENLFWSYLLLAEIARSRFFEKKIEIKYWSSKDCYKKCLEISQKLFEETGTVSSQKYMAYSYNGLGDTALKQPERKFYYEKGFEIHQKLYEETGTELSRRNLAGSYDRLGKLACLEKNYKDAMAYYEKGLEIRQKLYEESESLDSQKSLALSYYRCGDVAERAGNISEAKKYFEKELEITRNLCKEIGTVESQRNLFHSYTELGRIARLIGDLSEAKNYYKKGLEIAQKISKEQTGSKETLVDLSFIYAMLGQTANEENNLEEAKFYFTKQINVEHRSYKKSETGDKNLAKPCYLVGVILYKQGRVSRAMDYFMFASRLGNSKAGEVLDYLRAGKKLVFK